MWNLDLAFADVVATSSDPHLGAIRLAWWRERLEQLNEGVVVPAEPRLQAVEAALIPHGVTGKELSQLEDAWLPLLQPLPWNQEQIEGLILRGRILFGIGARLLGGSAADAGKAGELWAVVDGARHCSDRETRELLMTAARGVLEDAPKRMPRELRPLTVLAALAAADLVLEGSGLGPLSAALRHRLTGSFPRS